MTLGEKITRQRKMRNYTQEQLAELLGVSRQSISKWESNIAYPETEKMLKLGELFDCSMDYLLKDECTEPTGTDVTETNSLSKVFRNLFREKKSQKTVLGLPLYHFGRNAKGFFAIGLKAEGVFAFGLAAKGIVSCGMVSMGILPLGLLSLGIFPFGVFSCGLIATGAIAIGLLAAGAIALGVFAAGAICAGVVSVGALSVGCFSFGALAIGEYVAVGDYARGMIAVGTSEAIGSVYQFTGELSSADIPHIKECLDAAVPAYLWWAKEIVLHFLH